MEEIDLARTLRVLRRYWWCVTICVFVAVIVAGAIAMTRTPVYEATVTLFEPAYRLQTGPSFQSLDDKPGSAIRLYPTLAKNEEIAERVVEALASILPPDERDPKALLSLVRVDEDKQNPAIFYIKARSSSPSLAQEIANGWAGEYVALVAGQPERYMPEFLAIQGRLAAAESKLNAAQEALARFEEETGLGLITAGGEIITAGLDPYAFYGERGKILEAKIATLANHRIAQDALRLLLEKLREAKTTGMSDASALPWELLSVDAILERGVISPTLMAQQGHDLDALIGQLEREETVMAEVTEELSGEVTELRGELLLDKIQYDILQRDAGAALDEYHALVNKSLELKTSAEMVQIIQPATTPKRPHEERPVVVDIAAAGVLGLLVGVLGAFALDRWKEEGSEAAPQRD